MFLRCKWLGYFFFAFIHSDLLSLHPPSLTHNNSQRHPKVHGTHPAGCKKQLIDWLIWRCFCRMSCSCDFCGCPCGCFLKTHISFSLCCALQKNLFYLSGHIKAQAWFFNLGFLFFMKWDSLLICSYAKWVPGLLTITICNKITHYMQNLVPFSLFLLCLNSWAKASGVSLSGLYWCRQTSSKFMVNANWL